MALVPAEALKNHFGMILGILIIQQLLISKNLSIMKMKLFFLAIIFMAVFVSCKKNKDESGVTYQMRTFNRSSIVNSMSGNAGGIASRTNGTIIWTSGFTSITAIEFEVENNNVEVEYESQVRQKIDLFASISTIGNINVPAGTYEEVEFEVHLSPNGTDAALELRGNYNGIPFIYRNNNTMEIEVERKNVVIGQNNGYNAIINWDLSLLSQGVSAAAIAAATITNGEIIISASSNVGLYNIITANLLLMTTVEFED